MVDSCSVWSARHISRTCLSLSCVAVLLDHQRAFLASYKDFVLPSKLMELWIGVFEATESEHSRTAAIRFLCDWLQNRYLEDFYHNSAANVLDIFVGTPELAGEHRTRLHMLSMKGLQEVRGMSTRDSISLVLHPESCPRVFHLNMMDTPPKVGRTGSARLFCVCATALLWVNHCCSQACVFTLVV
jgi:hypothetical protein